MAEAAGGERGAWTAEALDDLLASGCAVDRGVRGRVAAASDWGGIEVHPPPAVARPATVEQVSALVAFARGRGLSLTARGTGASQSGQALSADSVIVDTAALSGVAAVDEDNRTVTCGPGATWRALFARTVPRGLVPAVSPMQLDLSVGGVLSIGGVGSTSFRHGSSAGAVEALEVVTGTAEVMRCDRLTNRDLFDGVRAGLGRCGIITEARIPLRRVGAVAHVMMLQYDDIDVGCAALERAAAAESLTHVEGFGRRDGGPPFELHLATDAPDGSAEDLHAVAAELDGATIAGTLALPVMGHAAERDPRFDDMVRSGRATAAHPWVEAFVPLDALPTLLPPVLATAAGDENDRLQLVLLASAALPPLMPVPAGDLVAGIVAVPIGVDPSQLSDALDAMRRVNDLLLEAGGKRYLSGWFPDADDEMWRAHFGDAFEIWERVKQVFDPDGTFTSALLARTAEHATEA